MNLSQAATNGSGVFFSPKPYTAAPDSRKRVANRVKSLYKLARYIHLRHESWELLAEAARRNDPSAPAIFAKKSGEANTALQELNTHVGSRKI